MTQYKARITPLTSRLSHITLFHVKTMEVLDDFDAFRIRDVDPRLEKVGRYISLGGTQGNIYQNASGKYYYKKTKDA